MMGNFWENRGDTGLSRVRAQHVNVRTERSECGETRFCIRVEALNIANQW